MTGAYEVPPWQARFEDMDRHLDDLWVRKFEGVEARIEREALFCKGFRLVSPLARVVLNDINDHFLAGEGTVRSRFPTDDGAEGLVGWWSLSWPIQRLARDRRSGERLGPVRLVAVLPIDFLHPHFMAPMPGLPTRVVAWPFQILTPGDARRQEPVLRVLAEAVLHERIYQSGLGWKLFGRSGTA